MRNKSYSTISIFKFSDGIRIFVGTYSDIVAAEMMEILTREIEGWQRNGKTCRDSIFRPRNTAEIGEAVSICVFGASTHILDVQFLILANVEQAQVETHDIQLALMRELQTANVLKEYDAFYANSVEMARQLRERFYNVTYPPLIESLEALDWSVENIPRLLQDCINAIPRKFAMFC